MVPRPFPLVALGLAAAFAAQAQDLRLSELVARNDAALRTAGGATPDLVELAGTPGLDLGDYYVCDCDEFADAARLSDYATLAGPGGAPADGRAGVYLFAADGSAGAEGLPFKLSGSGETVTLFAAGGHVLDQVTYPELPRDHSYGRGADGAWGVFLDPTPGTANGAHDYAGALARLTVTAQGPTAKVEGAREGDDPAGYVVRFTDDGTPVTAESPVWGGVTATTPTTLRLRAFAPDYLPSPEAFATLFPGGHPSELPVVSVTVSPEAMFDSATGIYALGPNPGSAPRYKQANYNQDVEVPAHVAVYLPGGEAVVAQEAGLKIYGGYSRTFP